MKRTKGGAVRLWLAVIMVVVGLSLVPAGAMPIPPEIPRPSQCQDDEIEACIGNWSIVSVCVEKLNPGECGKPVRVKVFP